MQIGHLWVHAACRRIVAPMTCHRFQCRLPLRMRKGAKGAKGAGFRPKSPGVYRYFLFPFYKKKTTITFKKKVHPLHPLKNSVSNNTDSDTHGKSSVSTRCTLFAPLDAPLSRVLFLAFHARDSHGALPTDDMPCHRRLPVTLSLACTRSPPCAGVPSSSHCLALSAAVTPLLSWLPLGDAMLPPWGSYPWGSYPWVSDASDASPAADQREQRHALVHADRAPLGAPLGARGLSCDRCTHDLPPFSVSVATEDAKGCKGCNGCRFSTKVPGCLHICLYAVSYFCFYYEF